jgi:hypothetical protein
MFRWGNEAGFGGCMRLGYAVAEEAVDEVQAGDICMFT